MADVWSALYSRLAAFSHTGYGVTMVNSQTQSWFPKLNHGLDLHALICTIFYFILLLPLSFTHSPVSALQFTSVVNHLHIPLLVCVLSMACSQSHSLFILFSHSMNYNNLSRTSVSLPIHFSVCFIANLACLSELCLKQRMAMADFQEEK